MTLDNSTNVSFPEQGPSLVSQGWFPVEGGPRDGLLNCCPTAWSCWALTPKDIVVRVCFVICFFGSVIVASTLGLGKPIWGQNEQASSCSEEGLIGEPPCWGAPFSYKGGTQIGKLIHVYVQFWKHPFVLVSKLDVTSPTQDWWFPFGFPFSRTTRNRQKCATAKHAYQPVKTIEHSLISRYGTESSLLYMPWSQHL